MPACAEGLEPSGMARRRRLGRAVRRQLAELMGPVWSEYTAQIRLGETAFSVGEPTRADLDAARTESQPNPLLDEIESVPVVLVVGVDLRKLAVIDKDTGRPSIVGGVPIYPFCHNILLAARARGLGGVLDVDHQGRGRGPTRPRPARHPRWRACSSSASPSISPHVWRADRRRSSPPSTASTARR